MAASAKPRPRNTRDFTIRHDVWEDAPEAHRGLLGFSAGDDFLCLVLAYDPAKGVWSIGRARLPDHALTACRTAIVESLRLSPATADSLRALGLLGGRSSLLSQEVGFYGSRTPGDAGSPVERRMRAYRDGNRALEAHGHVLGPFGPDPSFPVLSPDQRMGFLTLPEARGIVLDLLQRPIQAFPANCARDRLGKTFTRLQKDLRHSRDRPEEMVDRGFADVVLKGWRVEMRDRLFPEGRDLLAHPDHWSNALMNRFRAPDPIGTYRRQAALLQPCFYPLVMSDPGLLALVDAGRPFEPLLLERLRAWVRHGEGPGLTEAKLRRMRSLQRPHDLPTTRKLLSIVARLPLHHIPTEELGWINFHDVMRPLDGWARRHGLDMPPILANGPKVGPRESSRWTWSTTLSNIYEMTDMLDRLSQTLVEPALPGIDREAARRIAGRFMLSGLNGPAIERMQGRWHERLQAFEGALPQGRDLVSWPALLPPYTTPDGTVRITFLTCQSELRLEGGGGPEDDAHAGLSHCVGGYSRSCYAGTSHIASIRKRTPRGWMRLSTAEFTRLDGTFGVVQHKGRENGLPPPEAVLALQELTAALRDGILTVNEDAAQTRDPSGFRDGIDWSDASLRESALEAWRPFLPRRHAKLDYPGLVRVLGEIPPD